MDFLLYINYLYFVFCCCFNRTKRLWYKINASNIKAVTNIKAIKTGIKIMQLTDNSVNVIKAQIKAAKTVENNKTSDMNPMNKTSGIKDRIPKI